jgi:ADP-heptose:LPS heptosyltransferase
MFFSKFLRSKIEAKNILVHAKDHFFGESVLQIPFFRSLRSRFPNAKITLGISFGKSPYRASLASIAGQYVNDVEENLQICKSYRNALPFTQIPLSDKFFDLIIDLEKQWWRTLAVRRIPHKIFISASRHFLFSDRIPNIFRRPSRLIDQHFMLLQATHTKEHSAAEPNWLNSELRNWASNELPKGHRYIGLAVGSGDPRKTWPLENFLRLAALLINKGLKPVFLLGPSEGSVMNRIKKEFPNIRIPGWENGKSPSPPELVALSEQLHIFISNDSGMAHLLAVAKTPHITLWGFTNANKYRHSVAVPHRQILADEYGSADIRTIPLQKVIDTMDELLVEIED